MADYRNDGGYGGGEYGDGYRRDAGYGGAYGRDGYGDGYGDRSRLDDTDDTMKVDGYGTRDGYGTGGYDSEYGTMGRIDKSMEAEENIQKNVTLLTVLPLAVFSFLLIVSSLAGATLWITIFYIAFLIKGTFFFFQVPVCGLVANSRLYSATGLLVWVAVFVGGWSGMSNNARFFHPYMEYLRSPTYTNVLPSDLAMARADAAIIGFDSQAVVDTFRSGSVTSPDLQVFCVAPIFDESGQSRAEFWAVGNDCCNSYGGFHCDDALDISCKSGLVIRDENSSFTPPVYGTFLEAVRATAAKNQLQIPDRPVLLRWKNNPSETKDWYLWSGILSIVIGIVCYAVMSAVFGCLGGALGRQEAEDRVRARGKLG